MCEMLAVAFDAPRPFSDLHDAVSTLEIYGLGGFGWGVAWLADDGVRVERGLGRYVDEGLERGDLQRTESTRFLVHLRRPNKLSTVQYADTQPFFHGHEFAFCHNGFFDRAAKLRPSYEDRLNGGADSEVGWLFLTDRLAEGVEPTTALREVDKTFEGKVNLGYLGADGLLAVYSRNLSNAMWTFTADGATLATTSLHSDDDSIFTLVFPKAEDRALVPTGTAVVVGSADSTTQPTGPQEAA
jgi:predicted glutamine amidotransferase